MGEILKTLKALKSHDHTFQETTTAESFGWTAGPSLWQLYLAVCIGQDIWVLVVEFSK